MGSKLVDDLAANDLIYVKRIPCGKIVKVYTVEDSKYCCKKGLFPCVISLGINTIE